MKTKFSHKKRRLLGGYTLIETLVATGILMFGVGAAASMSMTLITVEEINERTVRAMNYLENAANLYRLGFETGEIQDLLPADPVITNLAFTAKTQNVAATGGGTSIGSVSTMEVAVTFKPANTDTRWRKKKWTGGNSTVTRTHKVEVLRPNKFVSP